MFLLSSRGVEGPGVGQGARMTVFATGVDRMGDLVPRRNRHGEAARGSALTLKVRFCAGGTKPTDLLRRSGTSGDGAAIGADIYDLDRDGITCD